MSNYYIIENDKSIIRSVSTILDEFPMIKSMGSGNQYDEAMNIILQRKPDLVFLNIDDIIESPFEFVSEIQKYLDEETSFVAISHCKEKAYEALKNNFIDFLLHPISELELRKTVLKFKKKHLTIPRKTICLKSYKDYHYLCTNEILFLKADNNSTDFFMTNGKVINAFKTLKTFETILPQNFLRIHKSYIVNKDFVTRINYGNLKCTLKQVDNKIPFTKTYIDKINHLIDGLSETSLVSLN